MGGGVKCLTICEPHASAFMFGPKSWENRTVPTSHRGWMLVHAGKSLKWMDDYPEVRRLWPEAPDLKTLHGRMGLMLGVVEIRACAQGPGIPEHFEGGAWVRREPGSWAWGRSERRFAFPEPFPWRGFQGLYDVEVTQLPEGAIEVIRGLPT